MDLYNQHFSQSQEKVMERASKLGDFSQISEEFTIDNLSNTWLYFYYYICQCNFLFFNNLIFRETEIVSKSFTPTLVVHVVIM